MSQKTATPRAALAGLKVVDMSRLVAGNALSHVLADLGADVIKIENPKRGDDLRHWRTKGISAWWKVYARGKRSLALDFRAGEGRELFLKLIATADVLVENFIPGGLEKYDLGPEVLHEVAPKLVIARISGWGQSGPWRERPGFGTLVEAMSGFAAINGFGDRPPTLPPTALADMYCGLYGVGGVLAALREVEVNGGLGQVVDLSLFEAVFSTIGPEAANYRITGAVTPRLGSRSAISSPRNTYLCADGKFVAMSAAMQSMTEKLFDTIGRPELKADPRFASNSDRLAHGDALDEIIGGFIATRTQAENLAIFAAAGVTVGPVCDIADLMEHPFVQGREVIVEMEDAEMGSVPMHNIVARLSRTPGRLERPAPSLGQDTADILTDLGTDAETQARLRAAGIIA